MSRIVRAIALIGPLLILSVLAIDFVLIVTELRTIDRGNELVDQTRAVIDGIQRILSLLKDAETGQRGFILTGREDYLDPYRDAEADLDEGLASLRVLTAGDDAYQARFLELERIARETMDELRGSIEARRGRGFEAAREVVLTDLGLNLMDRFRQVAAEVRADQERALAMRAAATRSAVRWTIGTSTLTTGLALVLLIAVAHLQRREASERERAGAEIRRSEAWLSTTLMSIGDAVIATDQLGNIRFMNAIAGKLTGWAGEDAVGRPLGEVFRIVNETTRQPAENPVERVLREGVILGLANHSILIARDGTETPIDDSAAPIRGRGESISGAVLVFRDISERKEQEARLEEQRRLVEFGREVGLVLNEGLQLPAMLGRCAALTVRYLDAAFSRVWTLDETGDVLELMASEGMYTHLDGGHARIPVGSDKIGRIALERKPHLTNAVFRDSQVPNQEWAVREGMAAFAGYPLIVEDRLIGVWAMFSRRPLTGATLRAMESVASGIALGIERRRAVEDLAERESWLWTTLSSIGDAVIATDERGQVRFLNAIAESLTGWTLGEVAGKPMEEVFRIVNETTRQPAENPVEKVLREGVVVGLANHTILIARDGTDTPIEDSAAPIRGLDGTISGVVMVFRDVTEARAAQDLLRASEARK